VRWDDPAFGFDWPLRDPLVSARDAGAPALGEFLDACRARGLDAVTALA
jgi:hypothetical protein